VWEIMKIKISTLVGENLKYANGAAKPFHGAFVDIGVAAGGKKS